MKLSKSILRPRDFSFLSRHLRSNGSRKGGQSSGSFPFGKRRSGCGFESHEPSSPKVTCIGQVRVKSKRKAKQCRRSLSKREASFRKMDQSQQQVSEYSKRWVHLPISICEALRGFGAELCCLFPCRSRCCCFSKRGCCGNHERRCGTVFCRWLLCLSDGGGRKREIEVVVGGVEAAVARRHVFENIEVRNGRIEMKGQSVEEEEELEEPPRVSICIPPKNALLLMRCRSDPMKMAALANRITWASSTSKYDNGDIEEEFCEEEAAGGLSCEEQVNVLGVKEDELDQVLEQSVGEEHAQPDLEMEVGDHDQEELVVTVEVKEQEALVQQEDQEEEVESNMSSFEALLDQENTDYEDCPIQVNQQVEENPLCNLSSESNEEAIESQLQMPKQENKQETEELIPLDSDKPNQETVQPQVHQEDEENVQKECNQENHQVLKKENESPAVLPDCLLLMMCEPKLSMEVSKETWVRGTDFIRWLPARKPAKAARTGCCHHEAPAKRRPNNDSKPRPSLPVPPPPPKKNDHQPPRSSCSLPAASMANMLEQKLANAAGGTYEPFVLTRCKSEPMRTAADKPIPESCFWKNASLKMEPHRVSTLGVGAAGIS